MNWRLFVIAFVSVVIGIDAHAYELGTHARLTQKAYEQSALGNAQIAQLLFKDLGIELKDNPFGDRYYDVSGADVRERSAVNQFELKFMPEDAKPLSIEGWLLRGAIREDDYTGRTAPNPQDDPYFTDLDRPLNHFYDPVQDRPLTVLFRARGAKALDWGLGSLNTFAQPPVPDPNRRNHFTVFDAREAMYRALTGRNSQGQVIAATKEERDKYWATTFRALGDLLHLVQDMGQPQHTRNDGRIAPIIVERRVLHEKA